MRASRICFLTLVLISALTGEAIASQLPSLAGIWIPDPAASTHSKELKGAAQPGAPVAPPAPSVGIRDHLPTTLITHVEPRLTVEFLGEDGNVISKTELTTDGKENVNSRAGGAMVHKSVSTWVGDILRTTWKIERDGRVGISGVDERAFKAPDTLVVTTTTEDSKSRSRSVIVYHRSNPFRGR
jgi:hypothetical protein